jgi:hypothetical protein
MCNAYMQLGAVGQYIFKTVSTVAELYTGISVLFASGDGSYPQSDPSPTLTISQAVSAVFSPLRARSLSPLRQAAAHCRSIFTFLGSSY